MAKLNRQQLNAIKEKVRQQKVAAAQQKQIEELKLKESGNTQPQSEEKKVPTTLAEVKKALEKQKQEETQNNTMPSKKSQLKAVKRQARGLARNQKPTKVNWNCSIGDLVHVPERWSGVGESLYGIVVKMAEDNRSGRRSAIENDSTQVQVLTSGGFRWYYVKSLRTV